jgi:hypothetical protein
VRGLEEGLGGAVEDTTARVERGGSADWRDSGRRPGLSVSDLTTSKIVLTGIYHR